MKDSNLTFVDIPGMLDTNGGLIELINAFMTTAIIHKAKSVRFLLPISYGEISNSRGGDVRDSLTVI